MIVHRQLIGGDRQLSDEGSPLSKGVGERLFHHPVRWNVQETLGHDLVGDSKHRFEVLHRLIRKILHREVELERPRPAVRRRLYLQIDDRVVGKGNRAERRIANHHLRSQALFLGALECRRRQVQAKGVRRQVGNHHQSLPFDRAFLERTGGQAHAAAHVRNAKGRSGIVDGAAKVGAIEVRNRWGRSLRRTNEEIGGLVLQQVGQSFARQLPALLEQARAFPKLHRHRSIKDDRGRGGTPGARGGGRVPGELRPGQRHRKSEQNQRPKRIKEQPLQLQPRGGAALAAQHEGDRPKRMRPRPAAIEEVNQQRNQRGQSAQEHPRVHEGHRCLPCLRPRKRSSTESRGSSVRTSS